MNKKICFFVIIVISIFLCGCSYTKFEENIRDNFFGEEVYTETGATGVILEDQNLQDESSISEIENGKDINEDSESSATNEMIIDTGFGDKAIVKGIGETYYAYLKSYEYGCEVNRGYEGVYITLDSIEIFDNFYDAQVETNSYIKNDDGSISPGKQFLIDNASFIVVQLTAVYNKPEDGENEILFSKELVATYQEDPLNPISNRNKENIIITPVTGWLNDLPMGENEKLDPDHNRDCAILKDGIPYTYKLGIFADEYFIENEKYFLLFMF